MKFKLWNLFKENPPQKLSKAAILNGYKQKVDEMLNEHNYFSDLNGFQVDEIKLNEQGNEVDGIIIYFSLDGRLEESSPIKSEVVIESAFINDTDLIVEILRAIRETKNLSIHDRRLNMVHDACNIYSEHFPEVEFKLTGIHLLYEGTKSEQIRICFNIYGNVPGHSQVLTLGICDEIVFQAIMQGVDNCHSKYLEHRKAIDAFLLEHQADLQLEHRAEKGKVKHDN